MRYEHFTTSGTFRIHGIAVVIDNATVEYQTNDPYTATCIGARKKTKRCGEVDLDDHPNFPGKMLWLLNQENDFTQQAFEHQAEKVEMEKDMAALRRNYYGDLLSRADLELTRRY